MYAVNPGQCEQRPIFRSDVAHGCYYPKYCLPALQLYSNPSQICGNESLVNTPPQLSLFQGGVAHALYPGRLDSSERDHLIFWHLIRQTCV
ncbi:hypothetical protein BDZ89DRAFT_1076974 [Hymenopellis radicata]|nr:hypothetical protein BDZ89DRAFT_1076974 [Hymenopellis radicata]